MTSRRARFCATVFVTLLGSVVFGAPEPESISSWYYSNGRYDGVNILVTCDARTTIFRSIGFSFDTPVKEPANADAEVAEVCGLREKLLNEGFFEKAGFLGFNEILTGLVSRQNDCTNCRDLNEEQSEQCRQAYYSAIDWVLENEGDISVQELSKVLPWPIQELNEDMFYFLLSRGADPDYIPPQNPAYANATDGIKALVDTVPKSAVQLLELHIERVDEEEFPELEAAWRRMAKRANSSGAAN